MDIGCPNCAATYRVPDALLASGKPLRCVACGHAWIPAMPEREPAPEPALDPEPESEPWVENAAASPAEPPSAVVAPAPPSLATAPAPSSPARPLTPTNVVPPPLQRRGPPHHPALRAASAAATARRGRFLPAAWLASVLLVVLVLLGLVLYRTQLAGAWPPFARVAGLIGG